MKKKAELQISAGGLVYNKNLNKFLLIKDSYGRWALPKGKLEKDETASIAAYREISEETGISQMNLLEKLGEIKYYFKIHGQSIFKIVHYFLFITEQEEIHPDKKEIKDARWFEAKEAFHNFAYKNTKPLLKKAFSKLNMKLRRLE